MLKALKFVLPLLLLANGPENPEVFVAKDSDQSITEGSRLIRVDNERVDAAADKVVVCKSIYEVGSRIPSRKCRTKSEWAELAVQHQEQLKADRRAGGHVVDQ